jgi:hypothetical protein
VWLARLPDFELRWIWYLSVFAILLQLAIIMLLFRREFRIKFAPTPAPVSASAA